MHVQFICRFYDPLSILACIILTTSCGSSHNIPAKPITQKDQVWSPSNILTFESELEDLRKRYHIPSLSAGIVNEKKLVWKKGFGYADVENKIVPDEHTVYHLASITKTFGSLILMKLVEDGKVNLDDPISKYNINLGARWGSDPRIKVKHLLTHTASGNSFNGFKPGYSFRYRGDWYMRLDDVILQSSGSSFGELLVDQVIRPLKLKETFPPLTDTINFKLTGYEKASLNARIAKPYNWAGKRLNPVDMTYSFSTAAGLMSSVSDLALYSNAIDDRRFLKPETWQKTFTPFQTPTGKILQYGLGWFVKTYKGVKILWHSGWWFGYSALFIKIPEKDLTFILLANSQDLSRPFYLTLYPVPLPNPFTRSLNSDLLVSDFARAFINQFADL
jgi:CubicO group peptidase (beta-lactamase class C family)